MTILLQLVHSGIYYNCFRLWYDNNDAKKLSAWFELGSLEQRAFCDTSLPSQPKRMALQSRHNFLQFGTKQRCFKMANGGSSSFRPSCIP